MNEFLYNAIYRAKKSIVTLDVTNSINNKNIVIVSDEHNIAYHLAGMYAMLNSKDCDLIVNFVMNVTNPDCEPLLKDIQEEFTNIYYWNSIDEYISAKASTEPVIDEENRIPWQQRPDNFVYLTNLRKSVYDVDSDVRTSLYQQKINDVNKILDYNEKNIQNQLQIVTCIPSITEPLPEIVHAIAEREYEVVFRDKPENSPEKFVIKLEDLLRQRTNMIDRAQAIRLDRVFGPGIYDDDGLFVNDVYKHFRDDQNLVINDEDRSNFVSASYVTDGLVGIVLAMANGRKGNIYNISSWELSRFQLISEIYSEFPEVPLVLDTKHSDNVDNTVKYYMLNAKKSRLMHYSNLNGPLATAKKVAVKNTGLWYQQADRYIPKTELNVYYGRMNRIREIELDILLEVDKLCKENNIPYFLTAGTMLGAVRHKEFIPWDDDVDIGMLPEDYDRFVKLCCESLSLELGYQTTTTEKTSHYIHDKIRLKNSFFSTKYSDRYEMLNGVYIDVFLYYKAPNNPKAQQRFIKRVRRCRNMIGIRWANRKKKSRIHRICFTISHKLPASWFDKYYRHVLMKYEKKNTKYRIDGGFNLEKCGAFPDEWFHGTVDAEFCGYKFPILAHYDEFLTHWFSSHYMELLPVHERTSVHDVVRIDLGQCLFPETMHDPKFRDVDLRGELYEKIK